MHFCLKDRQFWKMKFIFFIVAVRSGELDKFQHIKNKYISQFKEDRTFTLILRLHHNVIKTAIRRISLAYSRISLKDVAKKLSLGANDNPDHIAAEYIIAKVTYMTILYLRFSALPKYPDKIWKYQYCWTVLCISTSGNQRWRDWSHLGPWEWMDAIQRKHRYLLHKRAPTSISWKNSVLPWYA